MKHPPAYSPLPWSALWAGAAAALRPKRDARATLHDLLAREFAADDVALFASGTQALQVALAKAQRVIGAGANAIVALPAFTCFDVATAAVGARLRIALYDVDPHTLSPDLDSLSAALERGARIVVVSPLFGLPVDWEAVQARTKNAVVIEDAAQGSGASWQGRPLGSLGSISVLSFGRGKGWTGAGGGAVLTRNADATSASLNGRHLATEIRVLALATAQWAFGRPSLYGIPAAVPWLGLGETIYRDPVPPRALPHVSAGLLLRNVAASRSEADARRRRADRLMEALADAPGIRMIPALPGAIPGYLRLPLLLNGGMSGLADQDMAAQLGVARSYPRPLSELPAVRERLVPSGPQWPGAAELSRRLITLPTHSLLSEREVQRLVRAVVG